MIESCVYENEAHHRWIGFESFSNGRSWVQDTAWAWHGMATMEQESRRAQETMNELPYYADGRRVD